MCQPFGTDPVSDGAECRLLQGWDTDSTRLWKIPSCLCVGNRSDGVKTKMTCWRRRGPDLEDDDQKGYASRDIPHRTLLPGLQFSLAGILGKPETFYEVPAVRFAFEILSYV